MPDDMPDDMPDTAATIIVLATFRDGHEAHFAEYSARVRSFLDAHGARVVRRQRVEASLFGTGTASLVMLIDVPSRDAAERMFFEPAYRDIIPLRDRVFRDFQMYLAAPGEI
jgi:uncharacterized protein (DUF1330 family)